MKYQFTFILTSTVKFVPTTCYDPWFYLEYNYTIIMVININSTKTFGIYNKFIAGIFSFQSVWNW